jgi:hypothetical protein
MKIKTLLVVIVLAVLGFVYYKRQVKGVAYEKGQAVTIALKDLSEDVATSKEKYDGKRIMFDGYLGYSNSTFSTTGDDKTTKGAFSEAVFQIGVYDDIAEEKAEHQELVVLMPKTDGANGFQINKSVGDFTNDDVSYTTNEKQKISGKDKVSISADVKYFCLDNFNTKKQDCFSENPVTKNKNYYYNLVNIRIDKKQ